VSELTAGQLVLGRYRIVRALGRGGMGVVYLGRTEGAAGFARPVVVKRLHSDLADDQEQNEMFAREARILSNLQHPNIVSVLDFGREGQSYVMVLEYVHGYDLDQWFRLMSKNREPLHHDHVVYIARRVLLALHHAHELRHPDGTAANIIHRDVSLSNVLLDAGAQVKLHDFGIARMEGPAELPTAAGVFRGKLSLAAPELLRGGRATKASDVYTTAVMAYQLLSGSNPFKGETEAETLFRVLEHEPARLSSGRGDLPAGLDEVMQRALHKRPTSRYQSALELAEALGSFSSRSDEAVIRDLAERLARDFAVLPAHLRVESLAERDAAWREAQDVPMSSQVPLSSSRPQRAARSESPSPTPKDLLRAAASRSPSAVTRTEHSSPSWQVFGKPAASRSATLAVVLGAGVLALGILLLIARPRDSVPPAPRYLLLDNTGTAASDARAPSAPPSPSVVSELSAPSDRLVSASAPATRPARKSSEPPAKPAPAPADPAALSRQFRAHQPAVQSCFHRHAEHIEGNPRISVRFEVGVAGKVNRASLSPSTLEKTPLGECLLRVARAARFNALKEPVAFSIPITAQRGTVK